jgi:hypothetical protein
MLFPHVLAALGESYRQSPSLGRKGKSFAKVWFYSGFRFLAFVIDKFKSVFIRAVFSKFR